MNIITAVICVAAGVALSETYAYIRRRAEQDAYRRGYAQAQHEEGLRAITTDRYAVTTPRRLTEQEIGSLQRAPEQRGGPIDQAFMDRRATNGQATTWLQQGKGWQD